MNALRRHYDLGVTAATGAVLLALGSPWPYWAAWGALVAYTIGNRWHHRHQP